MPKDAVMDSIQNPNCDLDKALQRIDAEIQALLKEWELSSDDVGNDGYDCYSPLKGSWDCDGEEKMALSADLIREDPLYDIAEVDREIQQSFAEETTKETPSARLPPGKAHQAVHSCSAPPANVINRGKSTATDPVGSDPVTESRENGSRNGYTAHKSMDETTKAYIPSYKGFLNCEVKMEFDTDLIKEDPLYDLAEVEREALQSFVDETTGGVHLPPWKSPKDSSSPVEIISRGASPVSAEDSSPQNKDVMSSEDETDEDSTSSGSEEMDLDGKESPEEIEEPRHFLRQRKVVSYRFDDEDEDDYVSEERDDDDLDKNWSANDDEDEDDDEPLIETVRPRRRSSTRNSVRDASPKSFTK